MAWIESHDRIRGHPKARKLARELNVTLPQVIGHLHLLWWWAVTYAEDGQLSNFDAEEIAFAALWDGDPKQFRSALVATRWIDEDAQGARLHDWWDYAGKLVLARRAAKEGGARGNHERWHASRGVTDPACPYCDSPPESPPDSPPESGANRTVPNRTVQNLTTTGAPLVVELSKTFPEDIAKQAVEEMENQQRLGAVDKPGPYAKSIAERLTAERAEQERQAKVAAAYEAAVQRDVEGAS